MRIFLLCLTLSFIIPNIASAHKKEWTMLVYLNGNNSLDSFGPLNINQMEEVGSNEKMNVVVQWASLRAGSTKRLFIHKDNDPSTITSPVVQDLGKVDMGDYKSLVEFVRWGVQNYPAKHYFIDVWDHGGGWHINAMQPGDSEIKPMDISWDDNSGNFFTIPQLGLALKESAKIIGHKVDLYGSDACLMAMPEVSTELSDSVEVFAGSEETEPGEGWPYKEVLQGWSDTKHHSPEALANLLADEYLKSYQGGSNGTKEVTFSSFDLSKSKALNTALKALASNIASLSKEARSRVVGVISNVQTYAYGDFGDLGDFITSLEKENVEGLNPKGLAAVKKAMSKFVLLNKATQGRYSHSNGVSIWLPSSSYPIETYWEKYSTLKFQQSTQWGDAMKSLYKE